MRRRKCGRSSATIRSDHGSRSCWISCRPRRGLACRSWCGDCFRRRCRDGIARACSRNKTPCRFSPRVTPRLGRPTSGSMVPQQGPSRGRRRSATIPWTGGGRRGAADFAGTKRPRCRTRAVGSVRNLGLPTADPPRLPRRDHTVSACGHPRTGSDGPGHTSRITANSFDLSDLRPVVTDIRPILSDPCVRRLTPGRGFDSRRLYDFGASVRNQAPTESLAPLTWSGRARSSRGSTSG